MHINKYFNFFKRSSDFWFWLILLLLFTILRIPSLLQDWWYGDENIYMAIGQGLWKGKELYTEVWDHKPPLIYFVYALSYGIFGNALFPIRLLNLLLAIVEIISVFFISKFVFNFSDRLSKLSAATTAFILVFAFESIIFNGENLFVPFVVAGFAIFSWEYKKYKNEHKINLFYFGIAATCWSLAILTKAHALAEILVLGFILVTKILVDIDKDSLIEKLKNLFRDSYFQNLVLVNLTAFVLPWVGLFAYYGVRGKMEDFLYAIWGYNQEYIGSDIPNMLFGFEVNFLSTTQLRLLIVILSICLSTFLLYKKQISHAMFSYMAWSVIVGFVILLPDRPYPHYLLQGVPHIAIGLSYCFYWLKSKNIPSEIKLIYIAFSLLLFSSFITSFTIMKVLEITYVVGFSNVSLKKSQLRKWQENFYADRIEITNIIASNTDKWISKDDEMYVIGNAPEFYIIANRNPAYKYVVDFHFSPEKSKIFFYDLKQNKDLKLLLVNKNSAHYQNFEDILKDSFYLEQNVDNWEIWIRK